MRKFFKRRYIDNGWDTLDATPQPDKFFIALKELLRNIFMSIVKTTIFKSSFKPRL